MVKANLVPHRTIVSNLLDRDTVHGPRASDEPRLSAPLGGEMKSSAGDLLLVRLFAQCSATLYHHFALAVNYSLFHHDPRVAPAQGGMTRKTLPASLPI
jgi:hypothetical protein